MTFVHWLALQEGWTYSTRILDKDYDILATGLAYVVQDDFINAYQRLLTRP